MKKKELVKNAIMELSEARVNQVLSVIQVFDAIELESLQSEQDILELFQDILLQGQHSKEQPHNRPLQPLFYPLALEEEFPCDA